MAIESFAGRSGLGKYRSHKLCNPCRICPVECKARHPRGGKVVVGFVGFTGSRALVKMGAERSILVAI